MCRVVWSQLRRATGSAAISRCVAASIIADFAAVPAPYPVHVGASCPRRLHPCFGFRLCYASHGLPRASSCIQCSCSHFRQVVRVFLLFILLFFAPLVGGRDVLQSSYELHREAKTSSGLLFVWSSFSCEVGYSPRGRSRTRGCRLHLVRSGCDLVRSGPGHVVRIDCAYGRACRGAHEHRQELGLSRSCFGWPPHREEDDDVPESPASCVVRSAGRQNPEARSHRGARHRQRSCSNKNACSHKSGQRLSRCLETQSETEPGQIVLPRVRSPDAPRPLAQPDGDPVERSR